jgi:lipoprotein NlpI
MPNSAEVHNGIGETYMAKGDNAPAALAFNKVMELDPKNKTARQRLSDMKLRGLSRLSRRFRRRERRGPVPR